MKSLILRDPELRSLLDTGRCEVSRIVKTGFRISDDGLWMENGTAFLRRINGQVFTDEQLLSAMAAKFSPLGSPGEVRWVRETWASDLKHHTVAYKADGKCGAWAGDGNGGRFFVHHGYVLEAPGYPWDLETLNTYSIKGYGAKWRSASTMPRWASRLNIRVVSVSVERVDVEWWWVGTVEKVQ